MAQSRRLAHGTYHQSRREKTIHFTRTLALYIASNLKHSEAFAHKAPIILVSSEPYNDEIRDQCVESDVDGYVQKPMTEALLATILDEYIPNKEISLLATSNSEQSKLFLRKRHT